jgi:hypothetical protein
MVRGTVANAGLVIRHLRELGFEEDAVRHRVVAWCPQVLAMPQVGGVVIGRGRTLCLKLRMAGRARAPGGAEALFV